MIITFGYKNEPFKRFQNINYKHDPINGNCCIFIAPNNDTLYSDKNFSLGLYKFLCGLTFLQIRI